MKKQSEYSETIICATISLLNRKLRTSFANTLTEYRSHGLKVTKPTLKIRVTPSVRSLLFGVPNSFISYNYIISANVLIFSRNPQINSSSS